MVAFLSRGHPDEGDHGTLGSGAGAGTGGVFEEKRPGGLADETGNAQSGTLRGEKKCLFESYIHGDIDSGVVVLGGIHTFSPPCGVISWIAP